MGMGLCMYHSECHELHFLVRVNFEPHTGSQAIVQKLDIRKVFNIASPTLFIIALYKIDSPVQFEQTDAKEIDPPTPTPAISAFGSYI